MECIIFQISSCLHWRFFCSRSSYPHKRSVLTIIITFLYFTKCNEINEGHLDEQNPVSHKKNRLNSITILYAGSYKRFRMH